MNYLWKNSKRVIVYEKKVPAWSSLDGWFWYHIDIKKNRIWCRQLRNVVNFSHATQKPQRLPPLGFSCINENYDRYKKRSCMEFHTASWPVRESNPGLRRERASSWPLDQQAFYFVFLSLAADLDSISHFRKNASTFFNFFNFLISFSFPLVSFHTAELAAYPPVP